MSPPLVEKLNPSRLWPETCAFLFLLSFHGEMEAAGRTSRCPRFWGVQVTSGLVPREALALRGAALVYQALNAHGQLLQVRCRPRGAQRDAEDVNRCDPTGAGSAAKMLLHLGASWRCLC